jgi:hypothetical protein
MTPSANLRALVTACKVTASFIHRRDFGWAFKPAMIRLRKATGDMLKIFDTLETCHAL